MRLLPQDTEIGWTPYAFLVYFAAFPVYAILKGVSIFGGVLTAFGCALFLGLYFLGYWFEGKKLLWIVAGLTLLGAVFLPYNPAALVFFIYASAFIGRVGESGFAGRVLGALLAIIAFETWMLHASLIFVSQAMLFPTLIGSVNIHNTQRRRYNQKLSLAQEEIKRMAQVAERERIARDLHDVLGHTLSLIVLKSTLVAKIVHKNPQRAVEEINDIEQISRDALAQVRSTIKGDQPPLNLQSEVEHAKTVLAAANISVSVEWSSIALSPAQESSLAFVLREATTNILRHSKAQACTLRLAREENNCRLEIQDDGMGQLAPEGNGLSGMRGRVESMGGTFLRQILSGTHLIITIPLD
jgi:two-component system sensor histidine kinase DesK